MFTKGVLGKTFLSQSSVMHLCTHSCALTSLVERNAAPIFHRLEFENDDHCFMLLSHFRRNVTDCGVDKMRVRRTVNSLTATTSRKPPPPVSEHFLNNRFVSQLNTVPTALL